MRKIQIYCDCCGEKCNNTNEIIITSYQYSGTHDLCDTCLHKIIIQLTKFNGRIKETIEKSILD